MAKVMNNGKEVFVKSTVYPTKKDLQDCKNINEWYIYLDTVVNDRSEPLIDQANELLITNWKMR